MDAPLVRLGLILTVFTSAGATYRTPNFVVTAPTEEIAKQVGDTAEYHRDELAVAWLGKKMPRWYKPCTLTVKVGQIGAGGATTFAFDRGEVYGWRMNVQGTLERILDSVVPHEVSHTVLACHFRRPLPRWADEGAATLVEHESEQNRQRMLLQQVWQSRRRIPLPELLEIKEYPRDMQDVLTLYAEGYSLADFLVQAGGKQRYLEFLETAHQEGWDHAVKSHYSLEGVSELESRWDDWILAGSPRLNLPPGTQVAANDAPEVRPQDAREDFSRPVIRSQSPDPARNSAAPAAFGPPATTPRTLSLPPSRRETVANPVEESAGWQQAEQDAWVGVDDTPAERRTPPPFATGDVAPQSSPRWTGFPRSWAGRDQERVRQ
jgi:hypothetical protein